jgi:hypothetical protein
MMVEDTDYGIVNNQWNEGYDPIVSGSSAFTPALSASNTLGSWNGGATSFGGTSDLWSTVRPESTYEYTPNTNVMPGYRVKYNAAGNATGVEPIPTSVSPTSRTQSGYTTDKTQTVGGNTHQTQSALGTTALRQPENQSVYSFSASAPASSITTGTSINTTRKIPTMALPSYTEVPAISMPGRDPMRERVLAQEEASLGVGEWRQSIRSGLNKVMSEGNFASRGSQMRQLFAGAGQALGRILQSASSSARQQYNAEQSRAIVVRFSNDCLIFKQACLCI